MLLIISLCIKFAFVFYIQRWMDGHTKLNQKAGETYRKTERENVRKRENEKQRGEGEIERGRVEGGERGGGREGQKERGMEG